MIARRILPTLQKHLAQFLVVLLGPRQTGKTTLALCLAEEFDSVYIDLESEADKAKLADPVLSLQEPEQRFVILDAVHRLPGLFQSLRGLVDARR